MPLLTELNLFWNGILQRGAPDGARCPCLWLDKRFGREQSRGVNQHSSFISRRVGVLLFALTLLGSAGCGKGSEIDNAADSGDVEKVKIMLKSNPGLISSRNPRGDTPLFHARDNETAEVLLTYKPDVNATNFFGETALLHTLHIGRAGVAELLLAHGANVNLTAMDSSPLYATMMSCGKRTAPHLTELLLAHGADVNFKSGIGGKTALHWAAMNDLTDCVKQLLAHGANVDAKDWERETPLCHASPEVMELLLSHGADINSKNKRGQTLLHQAMSSPKSRGAEFLLAHGAEINAKDNDGDTPLHIEASYGYTDVARLLITNHAVIDITNNSGETPLHIAALANRKDIVELLLANKADINIKDNQGRTPLDSAMVNNDRALAGFLREHGGHE